MIWTGHDCVCGHPIVELPDGAARCSVCARAYRLDGGVVVSEAPGAHAVRVVTTLIHGGTA